MNTQSPTTEAGRRLVEDEPRLVTGEHDMLTRVLAIEEAARAEGRREAVRALANAILKRLSIFTDEAHPAITHVRDIVRESVDRVAALNASESPPTMTIEEWRMPPMGPAEPVGDASESVQPPDGAEYVERTNRKARQLVGLGNASEQPPERHGDE